MKLKYAHLRDVAGGPIRVQFTVQMYFYCVLMSHPLVITLLVTVGSLSG